MSDRRYEDILRCIEARRRAAEAAPQLTALTAALDAVNALGFLEDLQRARLHHVHVYGPRAFTGQQPALWAGAAVWYKRRGYYDYRTLYLLGVWAAPDEAGGIRLSLGVKTLAFSAPAFNPESYYHHLRRRFDVYYAGDASPAPDETLRWSAVYDPAQRLAQRAALQAALDAWRRDADE